MRFAVLGTGPPPDHVADQDGAGLDWVTDGEERRDHYVLYVLRGLEGVDFGRLTQRSIRDGRYERALPTVTAPFAWRGPVLVEDYRFLAERAAGLPKVGLPGPFTAIDNVADAAYGGDREEMGFAIAAALRQEVEALVEAGCRLVQFDDPVLLRHPVEAQAWGLRALEACFAGLEDRATFVVHICCGYPDKPLEREGISYKADADYYAQVLDWLSDSRLDVISIEGAQSDLDLSVLQAAGDKTVMLGVLDVGTERVETVDEIVAHGREALRYLPPQRLVLGPDCGMLQLSQPAARAKLDNMVAAARVLNDSHP
jgi:5-methyltetrahydropteroyltriglutamate--homocysteine methyltransferase